MLLTGCQVHLILVVIHTDVDNVCQQLLIARDHFQLLVKTLNNSATHWSGRANVFLYHPEGPELGPMKEYFDPYRGPWRRELSCLQVLTPDSSGMLGLSWLSLLTSHSPNLTP